jgi:2-amino-4-hydroxy-6-hydroxymethyldihydropteridine diphosphokinase
LKTLNLEPKIAYLGIGSNLGDKYRNCLQAVDLVGQIAQCRILKSSDWVLTKPVGVQGQEWYVNGVLALETTMPAVLLLKNLLEIEAAMGRVRRERWDSRIIDLDLLLFGGDIIDREDLKVPHPRMHLRRFVLVPMMQLAPDLVHPLFSVTVAQLLDKLPEDDQVVKAIKET